MTTWSTPYLGVAIAALSLVTGAVAAASEHPPAWPAEIMLVDDDVVVRLEAWFSVESIVDCGVDRAPLTAYGAGPGLMTITPDPGVGPPIVLRYGARSWDERAWPSLVPTLVLVAPVGEDGARWDGGYAGDFEGCLEWRKP